MSLYPQEFENLLSVYLTDGIITVQEKRVLLKKAAALGLDEEEVSLYIDARAQQAAQQRGAVSNKRKEKKCPYCGAIVAELDDKCPECENLISPEATRELEEIIDALEEALINLKSGKNIAESKATVERYIRKANLYYGSHPKIKILTKEVNEELKRAKREGNRNQIMEVVKKNPRFVIFGIIMLIEIILYFVFDSMADSAMYDYDNYIGNRSSNYSIYESYSTKSGMMIIFLIITGIVAWVMRKNSSRKSVTTSPH